MLRRSAAAAVAAGVAIALAVTAPVVGDTAPPEITIIAPATGTVFDQELHIEAKASDPDGLGRITFQADGRNIKSFTKNLKNGVAVELDWRRARELDPGEHTITVLALDKALSNPVTLKANSAEASVKVRRVDASSLTKAKTSTTIKLSGSGRNKTIRGKVSAPAVSFSREVFPLTGKVRVIWEVFSNKRFKVRHKDAEDAAAPFRFTQRLAKKGRWRVRVIYDPEAPYAASHSKTITFSEARSQRRARRPLTTSHPKTRSRRSLTTRS